MIFHATHARWVTVLRRPIEAMATTVPLFLLLFIPLAHRDEARLRLGRPARRASAREALKLHRAQAAYLNVGVLHRPRASSTSCSPSSSRWRLFGWSQQQDASGDVDAARRSSATSARAGCRSSALAITFAAFDWLMSLNPTWFSTIFGVYYFAGSFVARAVAAGDHHRALARGEDVFGGYVNVEHTHNIGKLMLAFTCFWTYIAFSQLHADLDRRPARRDRRSTSRASSPAGRCVGRPPHRRPLLHARSARCSRVSLKRNPRQLAIVGGLDPASCTSSTSTGW